ncbi:MULTISPECIES: aminomethyl-transferring glycine dehydrogenase subunit GcvPB [unclassified Streptomyces]|uniref:aminomethyl-transferring glycine dehydrogenase subunit GcvPB n=1 Tax=unclassified Streptomyces TaxID=2593676 RepID=UPI00278C1A1C|nr:MULTISPECIES: aminomethyl-transferring glycine dehydrogenase subunit GcvPB [unclassified Streptomyces]
MSAHTTPVSVSPEEARIAPKPRLRRFHQASWDEDLIFDLSSPGERGVLVPRPDPSLPEPELPAALRRTHAPALPEMSQQQVLRHYLRLSQENLGADLNIDVGQGTCTMKYSPKVNDQFVRDPRISALHPLQDEDTVQGVLQTVHDLEGLLKEISGMDRVSLQPAAGSAAIYTNIAMIRAYFAARGELDQRDEVITTIFSHPSNAACAKTAGFKVITLHPDADGYPDIEALKAAVGPRTAALMITNPEDTGIYNPRIEEFVRTVHEAGGLCSYDQANANGILGITRARDAGFDLCHFNLHKTFSTPHACGGPAAGASAVTEDLAPYLPRPTIDFDGERYHLNDDRPESIGKMRPFYGVIPNLVRAYAWIMALGADGLRAAAETAVLNNNYLLHKVRQIHGVSVPYAEGRPRVEQVRYSWERLYEDTGVHSEEIGLRAADFGTHYWTSHHPYLVPEPMTLEPTESYTRADLDEFAAILTEVAREAYESTDTVHTAPHRSTIHRVRPDALEDPRTWAVSYRAYRRKVLDARS